MFFSPVVNNSFYLRLQPYKSLVYFKRITFRIFVCIANHTHTKGLSSQEPHSGKSTCFGYFAENSFLELYQISFKDFCKVYRKYSLANLHKDRHFRLLSYEGGGNTYIRTIPSERIVCQGLYPLIKIGL